MTHTSCHRCSYPLDEQGYCPRCLVTDRAKWDREAQRNRRVGWTVLGLFLAVVIANSIISDYQEKRIAAEMRARTANEDRVRALAAEAAREREHAATLEAQAENARQVRQRAAREVARTRKRGAEAGRQARERARKDYLDEANAQVSSSQPQLVQPRGSRESWIWGNTGVIYEGSRVTEIFPDGYFSYTEKPGGGRSDVETNIPDLMDLNGNP